VALADDGRRYGRLIVATTAFPWLLFVLASVAEVEDPLLVLSIYLGSPHVLATVGLYLQRDLGDHVRRHRGRYVVAPLVIIPASTLLFALAPRRVGEVLVFGFIAWQLHHFTKQNFGMTSFWCRATQRSGPSQSERRLILATTVIGLMGLVIMTSDLGTFHTAARVTGSALVIVGLVAVAVLARRDWYRAMVLAGTVLFYAPLCFFGVGFLWAAMAYQAAHGAQYYLMVGTVVAPQRRVVLSTVAAVVVGGIFLSVASANFDSGPLWTFGLAKGIVATHFVVDAGFWRLRDPEIRGFMATRFGFLRPSPQPVTPVAV